MSILRNRTQTGWTQIQNDLITNKAISHGAFRVACYLMSRPDGWKIYNKDIQEQLGINQNQTLANYWKELLSASVLFRKRTIGDDGKYTGGYDYAIGEEPEEWKNQSSTTENQQLTDDESVKNHIMENPYYGKPILCLSHTHIKTEHNKTDLSKNKKIFGQQAANAPDSNLDLHQNKNKTTVSEPQNDASAPASNPSSTDSHKTSKKATRERFIPPTYAEVADYLTETNSAINAAQFVDYYQARGWMLGKGRKMVCWKSAVRTWERNEKARQQQPASSEAVIPWYELAEKRAAEEALYGF